jgi:hypothetical protein
MRNGLDSKPQIWTLAADLGLAHSASPSRSILQFVTNRIRRIAKKFHCTNLNDLLVATAGEVETVFVEIHSDDELRRVLTEYVGKGEKAFANLEQDLRHPDEYAVTIRRVRREPWERQFVSVIDCRGDKIYRNYFSKWHELAHLLTLTPQMRLVFRRTHSGAAARDAEEKMMDIIAGEIGFFRDFLPGDTSAVSFESIGRIREQYCPAASVQAAMIGIVKALPVPCILLEARMALRKQEAAMALQLGLGIGEVTPLPTLRAVHVTVNATARELGIQLHKNWRVPRESVIARVFEQGGYSEAVEDLSWWVTSGGGSLDPCPVTVKAKKAWDSVEALLVPSETGLE